MRCLRGNGLRKMSVKAFKIHKRHAIEFDIKCQFAVKVSNITGSLKACWSMNICSLTSHKTSLFFIVSGSYVNQ